MSSEDILAQLAAEGAVESQGGFSIDKEKAREKMRQFQLADPRQYVLMLVQAAVHQGATSIEFEIDADDMRVWFDGEGYSRADLDDLFVSMFGDRGDSNLRSRQELAIALNAALALNPRWIRMWSHREGSAVSLELRGGAEALAPAQDADPNERGGTLIHVKQRFRPGLVLEFVRNLQGKIAEEFILRERACFAELPIVLDGDRISSGLWIGETVGQVDLEAPGLMGACGFRIEHGGRAQVHVLNAGVWVSTHELPAFPAGFAAMVDARALRKDVSQTDVVRDEAYTAMLGQLRRGLERSLFALVGTFHDDPSGWGALPEHVRTRMPTWIAERVEDPRPLEAVGDVLEHYLALPVWQQLDGAWVSTKALQQRASVDFVSRPDIEAEAFADTIRAESEEDRSALRTIFGEAVRDRTFAYETELAREVRRSEVMARRWGTELGEGLFLGRAVVQGEDIEGEVGLRMGDREEPVVQLVYEGCLLETVVLDREELHLPGFVAVVQGSFSPTADWKRARRDEPMAEAIHAVIAATAQALHDAPELGKHAPKNAAGNLRALAFAAAQPGFDRAFYRAVGFSDRRASRWMNEFGVVAPEDPFDPPHPLLRMRVFPQLEGPALSLSELRTQAAKNPVRVLASDGRWQERHRGYVLLDSAERKSLRALLGEDAVVDGEADYHAESARAQWLAQPQEPFALFGDIVHEVRFEAEGMEVKAGLMAQAGRGEAKSGRTSVRVMKEYRTVEFVPLRSPLAGVLMAVNWPRAPMVLDYASLDPDAKPALQRVADLAPGKLLASLSEAALSGAASAVERRWLRQVALAPFESAWLEPFDRCHDEAGEEAAIDRLCKLMQITAKRGNPPSVETAHVLFETGETGPLEGGPRALMELARAVGSRWSRLRDLRLFRALGRTVSVAQILADVRRHDEGLMVDTKQAPAFDGDVPRVLLVADRADRLTLRRVLGPNRCADGLAWFEQWRAREAFEQQPEVSLDLDRSAVLVAVPVQAKGTQGEIGLPLELPGLPVATILACRRRRRICSVEVPEAQASLVGVLESDGFGEERQFQSLSERDMVRVAAACRKARPKLALALAEAMPTMAAHQKTFARAWGRLLLELLLEGRGRRALSEPPIRALADLPLFEHIDGSHWTLDAIVGQHDEGEPAYTWEDGKAFDGEPPKLTFFEQPNVSSLLEPLIGALPELVTAMRQAQERSRARASSPQMPEPPGDAVEIGHVTGSGVEGRIWIDAHLDESAVALGDEEKLAGFTDVPRIFVVGGGLYGEAVKIEGSWEYATLHKHAEKRLRKRARELYEVVFERFDPQAEDRDLGWDRDRDALQRVIRRMKSEHDAGRKLSSAPGRRLYRSLLRTPLFELPAGRMVTLEQLERFNEPDSEASEPTREQAASEPESSPAEVPPEPEPSADAEPEARPEPEHAPPPTAEALLLDAIRTELRIARKRSVKALSNAMLDLVRFGSVPSVGALAELVEGAVLVDPAHWVTRRALEVQGPERARLVSLLASSVFTAFNLGLEEVTDQHEVEFHRAHARYLAT